MKIHCGLRAPTIRTIFVHSAGKAPSKLIHLIKKDLSRATFFFLNVQQNEDVQLM